MNRRAVPLLVSALLLTAVSSACGSDSTSKDDAAVTTAATDAGASSATTSVGAGSDGAVGDPTTIATSDPGEFCGLLADQVKEATTLATAVGTADKAAALERIKASNQKLIDAAPDEIGDAMVVINKVTAASQEALTSDDPAAASKVAELSASPEAKQAFADYRSWLTTNCPDLAGQLLPPGT